MKKFVYILAVMIFFACSGFAKEAKMFRLKNGQIVIIQEVHSNPTVIIDTWIKTGSIDEDDNNNGVAHFLEHLFFKGTKNHPTGEFDRILENKGAINNAATSKDFTHYYITIPSKDFDLALDLHADMLLNPAIPQDEMDRERKVVIEEINKDLKSPARVLHENLNSLMYKDHPYKRKVIGKSEIIENIPRASVLDFYNKHYSPSNMITIIIGDVNTNYALERVKEVFNSNAKKQTKIIYQKETPLTKQLKKVEYMPLETGYMLIGFRSTPITDRDSYAMDVLAAILGEGSSSVLNQSVKEKQRLAFSIDAGNSTFRDDGIFYVSATFEPDKINELKKAIFDEIKNIRQNGITDNQLQLAKNIIERSTYYSRESITNIATEIGYTTALTNDIKFYDSYLKNINCVSKEAVERVANKYLQEEKSAISILLPEGTKELSVSDIKQTTPPTTELISQNNQTYNYKLSNGATLLYTPNEINDIIAISIHSKGGQLTEKIGGTAKITASALLKGTKNYSSEQLAILLEDNGIQISPSVSADSFALSVLTTVDEFDKTMELLSEIVNNATFSQNEIDKVKSDRLNSIKSMRDIPLQRALEEYRYMIYDGSPYSISSKILEKNMPEITREVVIDYYNNIFAPENLVISVNGKIDAECLIKYFNNIFSKKETCSHFEYSNHKNRIPPITKPVEKVIKTNTQTAWILLGWQVNGTTNEKDYATLQVIDSLLGSGMSSRMFVDLREKQGLAYQLGSGYSANVLGGSFMLYIGTNPSKLEQSKKGLFEEIKKLKSEPVNQTELSNAKEKLLGNYILGLETNMDKAVTTGWYEASGRGYQFKDNYEDLINSVTSEDIIKTANKYFTDNYVLSVVTAK